VVIFLRELWLFGRKQAWACLFAGLLLALIILTRMWWPFTTIARYDALFVAALTIQVALFAFGLETRREVLVIFIFHAVATGMEIFKTSDAIQSWSYPEAFVLGIAHVPLFAGFMYSAVGSYIARVWRIFDFRFNAYPPRWQTVVLVTLIYVNFFTHHFLPDLRWMLILTSVWLYRRVWVYFRIDTVHRRMPLLLGWILVALFIWFAENISTWARVWIYPNQGGGWHPVSLTKLVAWYLLMLLSFVLVSLVHRPRPPNSGLGNGGRGAEKDPAAG